MIYMGSVLEGWRKNTKHFIRARSVSGEENIHRQKISKTFGISFYEKVKNRSTS